MKEERIFDNKSNTEMICWIGENAQDNWDIISKANQNDIWFHLANFPSCHVILRVPDNFTIKKVSKQTLINCASRCKLHSKFANMSGKIKIIYTEIKNVSKADKVGAVNTKKNNYLYT